MSFKTAICFYNACSYDFICPCSTLLAWSFMLFKANLFYTIECERSLYITMQTPYVISLIPRNLFCQYKLFFVVIKGIVHPENNLFLTYVNFVVL